MPGADIWAIEKGFSLAWPAAVETPLNGWLLKAGGGISRRSNSANPTPDYQPLAQILPAIEAFYGEQHLEPLVRILSIQPAPSEHVLQERGYRPERETRTLYAAVST